MSRCSGSRAGCIITPAGDTPAPTLQTNGPASEAGPLLMHQSLLKYLPRGYEYCVATNWPAFWLITFSDWLLRTRTMSPRRCSAR